MAQQASGDESSTVLTMFKRDINEGGAMFLNLLGRKFNRGFKTTNLVANQQYYQLSNDILRVSAVKTKSGSFWTSPILVTSEREWDELNATNYTGNYVTHYYVRGFDEIGLFPIPSAAVTGGLSISYEPQHVLLTEADFATGTLSVTNASTTITHSASGFTEGMVGRHLQVTDGSDGRWYKISAYVSTSELTLENYYEGSTGTGKNFRIGEVMKIPEAYQDAPVYYALDRYYLTQGDQNTAAQYKARFDLKVKSAKATYGHSTSQLGIHRGKTVRPTWRDLIPPITYP